MQTKYQFIGVATVVVALAVYFNVGYFSYDDANLLLSKNFAKFSKLKTVFLACPEVSYVNQAGEIRDLQMLSTHSLSPAQLSQFKTLLQEVQCVGISRDDSSTIFILKSQGRQCIVFDDKKHPSGDRVNQLKENWYFVER